MANSSSYLEQGSGKSKFFLGGLVELFVVMGFDFDVRNTHTVIELLFKTSDSLLQNIFDLFFEALDFAFQNSLVDVPRLFSEVELLLEVLVLGKNVLEGPEWGVILLWEVVF